MTVHGERTGISAGIGDDGFVIEMVKIRSSISFDGMQLLGVGVTGEIEPELVIKSNAINNKRVAIPFSDGVPEPSRIGVGGMRASVQKNLTVGMNVALEQE